MLFRSVAKYLFCNTQFRRNLTQYLPVLQAKAVLTPYGVKMLVLTAPTRQICRLSHIVRQSLFCVAGNDRRCPSEACRAGFSSLRNTSALSFLAGFFLEILLSDLYIYRPMCYNSQKKKEAMFEAGLPGAAFLSLRKARQVSRRPAAPVFAAGLLVKKYEKGWAEE